MARSIVARISKTALLHNLQRVRAFAPHSQVIAMIKANAYGHGLVRVANVLKDADYLGVACIDEAIRIREQGLSTPVILMEGVFREEELPLLQRYQLSCVVHHWPQVEMLQNATTARTPIWIKINTGMNRLGFQAEAFEEAYAVLNRLAHVEICGLMSHFAKADEIDDSHTQKQTAHFLQAVAGKPGLKSLANSAAILRHPQTHLDVVRPGLMLYGASPFPDKLGQDFGLKPAMELRSEIIAIQHLKPGDKVGYGGTWENKQVDGRIGIVACGYGDGYPWHVQSGTPVLVNGQIATICGRVSMDMIAIDIAHITQAEVGSPVTLWGGDLPIERVACQASTIPYELMCSFIERVPMVVSD